MPDIMEKRDAVDDQYVLFGMPMGSVGRRMIAHDLRYQPGSFLNRFSPEALRLRAAVFWETDRVISGLKRPGKVLLPRDFLKIRDESRLLLASNFDLDMVGQVSTTARLRVANQMEKSGIEVMVEEGVDVNDGDPRVWGKLYGTDKAIKTASISRMFDFNFGPHPHHELLHPETVYDLRYADGQNFSRSDDLCAFAVVAPYCARKNLDELAQNARSLDDFEKLMGDMIKAMYAINFLHNSGFVHRDIKPDNIFDGGIVFDNFSIVEANALAGRTYVWGTKGYVPDPYPVEWAGGLTPYFRDIFAFAMSLLMILPVLNDGKSLVGFRNFEYESLPSLYRTKCSTGDFVNLLEIYFSPNMGNPKVAATWNVIEKMIICMGDYTLADSIRDLEGVFGVKL